jgi:murein DD-endopeptidase MepM/ murein hydrolase activator NlpD
MLAAGIGQALAVGNCKRAADRIILAEMTEQSMTSITTAMADQTDLYAALRRLAATQPDLDLGMVLAGCDDETRARLLAVDQGLLRAVMRRGRGLPAVEGEAAVRAYLAQVQPELLFRPDPAQAKTLALLTAGQLPEMPAFSDRAFDAWFAAQGVEYGLGAYAEPRTVYQTAQFADAASPERRTIHTGIDVFAPAGTPVYAPLVGKVLHLTYQADPLDYGHALILQHEAAGVTFYTLYGHLAGSLPQLLAVGDQVQPGQLIAHLGDWHENGGWAAHIRDGNFFGVGHASLWDVWQAICIDPNLILRIPGDKFRLDAVEPAFPLVER